jgi:DNA-binding CsgD family transcriptional regulator
LIVDRVVCSEEPALRIVLFGASLLTLHPSPSTPLPTSTTTVPSTVPSTAPSTLPSAVASDTIHAIALWVHANTPNAHSTNLFPTNSFRVDTIPVNSSLVSTLPVASTAVRSTPISSQANSDAGKRDACRDEWARRQGAADFAASLLSIASSYTPEVLRCLSELIVSTREHSGLLSHMGSSLARSDDSGSQDLVTRPEPSLPGKQPFKPSSNNASNPAANASPNLATKESPKPKVKAATTVRREGRPCRSGGQVVLSPSEERVAELVSQGLSLREVESILFISAKTADFHLQSVYRKLNVHNRGEFANAFFHLRMAA